MEHYNTRKNSRGLSLAFWLNLVFSVVELIGGILTNSTAIATDALHDFTDALAIGLAVWLEKTSQKKRTPKYSYGFKRFSMLSALGMSIFLVSGSILMIIKAIQSFFHQEEIHSVGMFWLAVAGILVNGFAFLKIKNEGKKTAHNHANPMQNQYQHQ
ncbi:MAG TPA: cation diffusion facilitator family transporter, partial [Prolixibacteraceae bacterium]|nr:cation diffusion facilitator family transporter [Prolixibacteraceae bacterium]